MKVQRDGAVMKFKEREAGGSMWPNYGVSTTEYWDMAAELYEKATYMNRVDIIINPGTDREYIIEVHPQG